MDFKLETSPLSEECQQLAEKELRETPENVKSGITELRELLKSDETLNFDDDDETLTIFLRPCKWYAKSAFELVCSKINYSFKCINTFNFFRLNVLPNLKKNTRIN